MKYIFILIIFSLSLQAQLLSPPYKLNLEISLPESYANEIRRADGNYFIIHYLKELDDIPGRFRISAKNFGLVEAYNFKNASVIIRSINIIDVNNDGEDEVLFLLRNKSTIQIILLFPFEGIQKILFEYEYGNDYYSANLLGAHNKDKNQFYVAISENHPDEKSIRGIFAFDDSSFKLNWFLPLAEWISKFNYNGETDNLIVTTISYNNGLRYNSAEHKFRINNKPGQSVLEIFDKSKIKDTGESSDSESSFRIISSDGNILYTKIFDGDYISPILLKMQNELFISAFNRSVKENNEMKLFHFNIERNKIELRKEFEVNPSQTITILNSNNKILYSDGSNKIMEVDSNGNLAEFLALKNQLADSIKYLYISNDFIFFGSPDKLHIYDMKGELLAETDHSSEIVYLKNLDLFYKKYSDKIELLRLAKVPFWDRIQPETFSFLSIIFATSTSVIFFFWLLTMSISKKKIIQQKVDIEKSHNELKETTSKLIESEKLAVLGTIASSVAHELNSPLGAILNSAERLQQEAHIKEEIDSNLTLIKKSAIRAKTIIEKFLLSSRQSKSDSSTNIAKAINDWKELFERQFILSGVNLVYEIDQNLSVKISYEEFIQVLINILFNARDAIVSSKKEKNEIRIKTIEETDKVTIEFQDSGDGFEDRILEKAFDAFITTKESGKGTGLGLWISKRIINEADGSIKLSNTASGALVKISLLKV